MLSMLYSHDQQLQCYREAEVRLIGVVIGLSCGDAGSQRWGKDWWKWVTFPVDLKKDKRIRSPERVIFFVPHTCGARDPLMKMGEASGFR